MRLRRLLAASVLLWVPSLHSEPPSTEPLPALEGFSPDQADKSLDPCADFFQYACGKWMRANPIPPDQARSGTFDKLAIWNVAALRATLEEAAAKDQRTPVEQQAGDYYASCMDEAAIDKAGLTPLKAHLDRIAGLREASGLPELIASIHQTIRPANLNFIDAQYPGILFGIFAIADFDDARLGIAALDQSGMNLPGREFYLNADDKSKEIRGLYVKHVSRMLELSGETSSQAAADAEAVLSLETRLAKGAMEIIARRDPRNLNNKMSLAQVQSLTPSFSWTRYFTAMSAPASPHYLVLAPDFFRGMETLVSSEPVGHWRAYLRYSLLHSMAPFLSQPFVTENFDFFGRRLAGAQQVQPRWRRCSIAADADLGEAVGQAYVARYFPAESKARMVLMVRAIDDALHQDIDGLTWMSDKTKGMAHAKLNAQVDKIAYPDRWRDYSALKIRRDDLLGNVARASRFEIERRMAKFGRPVDRKEWGMTPPTVNAYEDAQTNTINFPAGILQPPFFEASQIDAVNFGAIGAVIGHEIIHGFDDQGRKFDADGNLRDWWTPEDAASYDARDKCIQEEYTQDVPEAGVKQDGKLSAGEDTADNGGIRIALAGLRNTLKAQGKDLDAQAPGGLTNLQSFFLSYANVWCGENRPEAARTAVMTQGHSLNRYRVNNVVANMPEFAHAFGCRAGRPMVRENACRVW